MILWNIPDDLKHDVKFLKTIADFNRFIKNYIKMDKLLKEKSEEKKNVFKFKKSNR